MLNGVPLDAVSLDWSVFASSVVDVVVPCVAAGLGLAAGYFVISRGWRFVRNLSALR